MGIVKRILVLMFGFLSGLFGFLSLVVGIGFIVMELSGKADTDMPKMDTATKIYMTGFLIIICELFVAFGIVASLVCLRCFFGQRDWITRIINYFWKRAVKFALILPVLSMCCIILFKIMEYFTS
jgi:hypothetical protein